MSVISKETECFMSNIFVDNTNLVARKLHNTIADIDEIAITTQETINVWEGCLKTIRGQSDQKNHFPTLFHLHLIEQEIENLNQ